ncbi:MAG: DUF72 domain-containing protein, partial [Chloroflexota bacterium]
VPRELTHDAALRGVDAGLHEFIERVRALDEKLGVLLFQFPPSFSAQNLDVLEETLSGLPRELRFAVEVRHASWYTAAEDGAEPELARRLRRYGVAWAATEYPDLPAVIYPTAPFLYIRWIGEHGSFKQHTHERLDRTAELRRWLAQIEERGGERSVYGFFNNDYAGFAAATANKFKEIAGLPVQPFAPPQQPKLF